MTGTINPAQGGYRQDGKEFILVGWPLGLEAKNIEQASERRKVNVAQILGREPTEIETFLITKGAVEVVGNLRAGLTSNLTSQIREAKKNGADGEVIKQLQTQLANLDTYTPMVELLVSIENGSYNVEAASASGTSGGGWLYKFTTAALKGLELSGQAIPKGFEQQVYDLFLKAADIKEDADDKARAGAVGRVAKAQVEARLADPKRYADFNKGWKAAGFATEDKSEPAIDTGLGI